jgi:hypothetical protein
MCFTLKKLQILKYRLQTSMTTAGSQDLAFRDVTQATAVRLRLRPHDRLRPGSMPWRPKVTRRPHGRYFHVHCLFICCHNSNRFHMCWNWLRRNGMDLRCRQDDKGSGGWEGRMSRKCESLDFWKPNRFPRPVTRITKTPWPEFASELYRPNDRR